MKKIILLTLFVLVFSCVRKEETTKELTTNEAIISNIEVVEKPFANPHLIYGSSFGEFLQVLYRQAKFEEMLKFTHSSSIAKHGEKAILERYESMKFNYNIDLTSSKQLNDNTFLLNYTSNIIATRSIFRLKVAVENDTVKVILPDNLKDFPN